MQNPWALFALATLALPWLFLRRRRPTTPPPRVSFPAIRLLAPSLRRAVRRKERRLLVLAAIRSFALLTLVLIWAAPSPSFLSFFSDASSTPAESRLTIPLQRVANGNIDGRPIRVLIVDGSDSGTPFPNDAQPQSAASSSSDAAFYLAVALNPTFDATQPLVDSNFPQVEIVSSADFALTPTNALIAFDAICWVDLSAPTDAELAKTERFLAAASPDVPRALLVFAGPRTDAKRWDAVWRRWNLDVQTLSVAFEPSTGALDASTAPAVRDALQLVANVNVKERFFASVFPGFERSGVDALPVWRSFPLVGSDAVPILRDSTSNVPTLTRLSAPNNGTVVWSATAPDASISALAFAPPFVPLVEKTVDFALQESLATHSFSDLFAAGVPTKTFAERDVQTQKNADAQLDKTSARRRLGLIFWGIFGVLLAFEFWRSAFLTSRVRSNA
ncbi:MAG: hypothetical protein IJ991_01380, partial [Thermoguttaceae bacterium]|nr:hypothetical protein [Thermoguttaceae bacterium]